MEYEAELVRQTRDGLLMETDKFMLPDYPLTEKQREDITKYRQQLRDITKQPYFPIVDWPEKPF